MTFTLLIFYFQIICEVLNSRTSALAVFMAYRNSLLARILNSRGIKFREYWRKLSSRENYRIYSIQETEISTAVYECNENFYLKIVSRSFSRNIYGHKLNCNTENGLMAKHAYFSRKKPNIFTHPHPHSPHRSS